MGLFVHHPDLPLGFSGACFSNVSKRKCVALCVRVDRIADGYLRKLVLYLAEIHIDLVSKSNVKESSLQHGRILKSRITKRFVQCECPSDTEKKTRADVNCSRFYSIMFLYTSCGIPWAKSLSPA